MPLQEVMLSPVQASSFEMAMCMALFLNLKKVISERSMGQQVTQSVLPIATQS